MIIFKKIVLFVVLLVLADQMRFLLRDSRQISFSTQDTEEQNIVVFVHGTVNPPRTSGDMLKVIRNSMADSSYEEKTTAMRNDPFFYQSQPIDALGLKPININAFKHGCATCLFAHIYNIVYNQTNPKIKNSYYTFGWNGHLNKKARLKASEELLKALKKEVQLYQASGIKTKITLVGYSHGGTVCLNMGYQAKRDANPLKIETLVLLGTPIQRSSYHLIEQPMFEKIYNIYSNHDLVQRMDWLSSDSYLLPTRQFIQSKKNPLPKKLEQIRIKIIDHPQVGKNKTKQVIVEPSHSNWWFFSWALTRKEQQAYPLKPVPIGVFVPMILATAQQSPLRQMDIEIILDKGSLEFRQASPEKLSQALMPSKLVSKFIYTIKDCIPSNYRDNYNQKYMNTRARSH